MGQPISFYRQGERLSVNQINPSKLLHSKWTAVKPTNKEKHFIVTNVDYDHDGNVIYCLIEAVLSGRSEAIDWKVLQSPEHWLHGWK